MYCNENITDTYNYCSNPIYNTNNNTGNITESSNKNNQLLFSNNYQSMNDGNDPAI